MNRSTEIGRLARADPAAARAQVLGALRAARGNIAGAARALGVTRLQAHRYVQRYALRDELARIRAFRSRRAT